MTDDDVIQMDGISLEECEKEYKRIEETLKSCEKNTLVIHVFSGHGINYDCN